ncbi:Beta-1,3-galactosyltransferase 1-like protein [Aphelenchoides besseyi]|nr:Beta-1,3-galactosyltransferase 1-like protein [Aphelenchoides besseyi]
MLVRRRRRVWTLAVISIFGVCLLVFSFQEEGIWFSDDSQPLILPFWNEEDRRVNVEIVYRNRNLSYQLAKPSKVCGSFRVLVFILTRPNGFRKREELRESWTNPESLPSDWLVRFVVGAQNDYETETRLQAESQKHGDLIRYNARDSYRNLFLKTHALFSWSSFCSRSRFVIKADDDSRLNFTAIDLELKEQLNGFLCSVQRGHRPFRNPFSKLYVPRSVYSAAVYPDYCQGNGYAVSTRTISTILKTIRETNFFPLEDVYFTGIMAKRLEIPLHDSKLFGHPRGFFCC